MSAGPHAPHKPSTPAPWYADHPIGNLPLIKGPYYNHLSTDKHGYFAEEPPISEADEAQMQEEQAYRLRSLLSVDDLVKGVREYARLLRCCSCGCSCNRSCGLSLRSLVCSCSD